MKKYIFIPDDETMARNNKGEDNLRNFINNVMTTYGIVEVCIEPSKSENSWGAITPTIDYAAELATERLRADNAEQELKIYAPLIEAVKKIIENEKITLSCEKAKVKGILDVLRDLALTEI